MKNVAEEIRKERAEKKIIEKYQIEMQENIQFDKQKFFSEMMTKDLSVTEVLDRGNKLGIDLSAGAYNIVLFKFIHKSEAKSYIEGTERLAEKIEAYADRRSDIILFRRDIEEWAFLIKAEDSEQMDLSVTECTKQLTELMEPCEHINYFGGIGKTVSRLRDMKQSYKEAGKAFSFRYFIQLNQILKYDEMHKIYPYDKEEMDMAVLDAGKIDREIVQNFLKNGIKEEISDFVEEYFYSLGEQNVKSILFRQYITMDIYFSVTKFLESIGNEKKKILEKCGDFREVSSMITSLERTIGYLKELFSNAIELRDEVSLKKYASTLNDAKSYIQDNYHKQDIFLNSVASYVNLSPSYFSSIFRQETGQTFIEYVTEVRMEKAKELLMCSTMKSSEIGYSVGYKDPHYFSYLFKKTQDCTPKEYRMRGKEQKNEI